MRINTHRRSRIPPRHPRTISRRRANTNITLEKPFQKTKKSRFLSLLKIWLLVISVTAVLIFYAFNATIKPMIESYAINQAKNRVTKIVNESVMEEIKENSINYGELVDITYSDTGLVTSMETKIPELNMLRSAITGRIITRLAEFKEQSVRLALGSILGGTIFSGRGPFIEVKLIPSNYIETRVENDFSEAGINQTRHRINLIISMTVSTIMPGYRFSSKVETNVVLSETVIVGAVPDAFTSVKDPSSELVGIIEDYSATPNK